MADPLTFDFITDAELRSSLQADHAEMQACTDAGAWKAVHVLSGSIIEAVLTDYLLVSQQTTKDPLKMDMSDLIDSCHAGGVLTEKTANLSTVVRGYRNLIHPGRVKRLNERADEEGARIAATLVSMIVREVAAKQAQEFGLTADQLLNKFQQDPSAFAISRHLLAEANPRELEKLLLNLIPERYFELLTQSQFAQQDPFIEFDPEALAICSRLFRETIAVAPDETKQKAAKSFVAVLRQDVGWRVEAYEEHLFRATDMQYLSEPERRLVRDHLIARIADVNLSRALVDAVGGLSAYITAAQITTLVFALARTVSYPDSEPLRAAALARLELEYKFHLPENHKPHFLKVLGTWPTFLEEKRGLPEAAQRIRTLVGKLEVASDDIPF